MASKTQAHTKTPQAHTDAPRAVNGTPPADDRAAGTAETNMHIDGILDQHTANDRLQHIPTNDIAPDTRPEMRQARLLPQPQELLNNGVPATEYRALVAELLGLGQSLKEHQIQPIIVYPGTSSDYPEARYLILVGHRRWTAASLVGLEALDAVVIDPPNPVERARLQYAENESREEFSDIERTWALLQMRKAMHDAPWEQVEERLQISHTRRQQLLRLNTFTPAQQRRIALLRLQETQLRSLHSAARAGELTQEQIDQILTRLTEIAAERVESTPQNKVDGIVARRSGIDGPTVARLVARARRTVPDVQKQPVPRWLSPLRDRVAHTSKAVQRVQKRVATLDDASVDELLRDLEHLADQITGVAQTLRQQRDERIRQDVP